MFWEVQHGYGEKGAKEKLHVSGGQIMQSPIMHVQDMGLGTKGTQEITILLHHSGSSIMNGLKDSRHRQEQPRGEGSKNLGGQETFEKETVDRLQQ